MTAATRFITLVIGIVGAAGVFLAPRRDEWLAMMRDEDKQAQVISLLEPRLARGENDPRLLATLGRSYAEIRNYGRAIELLQQYIALRPDDGDAYGRLADLYGKAGDLVGRTAMLERAVAIRPALSRAVELADLYHQDHRTDDEIALLSRFQAGLTVDNGLLLRLAELQAGSGNRADAVQLLLRGEKSASGVRPPGDERRRLLLAELLLQSGRSAEVVQFGKKWIVQWHEPWLADRLLRSVVSAAPVADASELAEAVAILHPDIRLYLVHGLATTGAVPVARHLLENWAKANPSPSMNEIAAFLSACRELDEPGLVWLAFSDVLRRPAPDELVARFSVAIAANFGIGALAPFWPGLPKAAIEQRSLLAAQLAFHENDLPMTERMLEKVDLPALEPAERRTWMDLLVAVASPPEVFEVLRERRGRGELSDDMLSQYARLAGGLGQEIEYRDALADLTRKRIRE